MTKEAVIATIWTRTNCPACTRAKKMLDSKQIPWVEKKLNSDANKRQFALTNKRSAICSSNIHRWSAYWWF